MTIQATAPHIKHNFAKLYAKPKDITEMRFPTQKALLPYLNKASGIAWDECHKIYILGDDNQVAKMKDYGYPVVLTTKQATPILMAKLVQEWFKASCVLRFIQLVETESDGDDAFITVVPQR